MANKVKYGLSQVHIAFVKDGGWDTPIHIPGAVNIAIDPAGDSSDFYGDNGPYFVQVKNNGYTGTLEVALFPDEVLAEMLGWYKDENGAYIEDADGTPKRFALSCQVEGDEAARRIVWYECEVARPSTSAQTTEASITPQTDTVDITIIPRHFSKIDANVVRAWCYKGQEPYSTWFEKVFEPGSEAVD